MRKKERFLLENLQRLKVPEELLHERSSALSPCLRARVEAVRALTHADLMRWQWLNDQGEYVPESRR